MPTKRERASDARRQRIFAAASQIIATDGYDALTTRGLAQAAGITAPTLYSLVGNKDEILLQMAARGVEDVWARLASDDGSSPLEMADSIIDEAYSVLVANGELQRAIIIAMDRLGISYCAHSGQSDLGTRAADRCAEMAEQACLAAQKQGQLRGNISARQMSLQMFISYEAPLRDWANQVITAEEMLRRQRNGFYLILAADAAPDFREQLIMRIANNAEPHPGTAAVRKAA